MAAANLALTQNDLRKEIAREAGMGTTVSQWSTDQRDQLTMLMKRTMRLVFQPPALPTETEGHSWSWLNPITTIALWPTYAVSSTRLITGAASTTITASTGTTFYQSMVGKSISFYTNVATPVFVQTSTIVSVNESAGTAVISASLAAATYQWAMTADGTYRAADEFLGMTGRLRHAAGESRRFLDRVSESRIGEMLSASDQAGEPSAFAIRPVSGFTGAAVQAWEFYVASIPSELRIMSFKMHLNIDALTSFDSTVKYIPGNSAYAELYRATALAVVESDIFRQFQNPAGRWGEWMTALQAAVMLDRRTIQAEVDGEFGDKWHEGRMRGPRFCEGYAVRNGTPITYNGTEIP